MNIRMKTICMLLWVLSGQVFAGQLVVMQTQSGAMDRDWAYSVYLPDGYENSGQTYPVFYLLHGNGGNHTSWPSLGIQQITDQLIANGDIPPIVIIMPEATTSWYVDHKENMETAIISELIPEVELLFRVAQDRSGRYVGGYSMGGYGAMRYALKYPEMFGGAALLSPAIYNPLPPLDSSARRVGVFGAEAFDDAEWESLNYPVLWDDFLASGYTLPMYINSGDDDQFYIEEEAVRFYSLLRRNNQPAELRIVNGGHTNEVWGGTIDDAMLYLFGH